MNRVIGFIGRAKVRERAIRFHRRVRWEKTACWSASRIGATVRERKSLRPGLAGNLERNVLRGLGADWQVGNRAVLQIRAEAFNFFNHPNFANPGDEGDPFHLSLRPSPEFGLSSMMLATGLAPQGMPGQLNPLFQIRGPRSLQTGLRLSF